MVLKRVTLGWAKLQKRQKGSVKSFLLQMEAKAKAKSWDLRDRSDHITFTPKKKKRVSIVSKTTLWGHDFIGEQANLIRTIYRWRLPLLIWCSIFQYYNDAAPFEEMIFKRTSQVGRNVELCHPPKYRVAVKAICKDFVKEKDSTKCGSNQNHVGNLCMSPMRQCAMKPRLSRCLNMFRISNPIEIDTDFYSRKSRAKTAKQTYEDFEEWIKTQVMINEMALEDIRRFWWRPGWTSCNRHDSLWKAVWMPISSCKGSLKFHAGKRFHDLPDGPFGERKY